MGWGGWGGEDGVGRMGWGGWGGEDGVGRMGWGGWGGEEERVERRGEEGRGKIEVKGRMGVKGRVGWSRRVPWTSDLGGRIYRLIGNLQRLLFQVAADSIPQNPL